MTRPAIRTLTGALLWLFSSASFAIAGTAHADDKPADEPDAKTFARVVVADADIRSGPSITYRVIDTAHRGEALALAKREPVGYWYEVTLRDGRTGYIVGDQIQPFDDANGNQAGIVVPFPLRGAKAGFAILGGVLRTPVVEGGPKVFGYMELRPSIVVHPTVTLDGFIGTGLTSDGAQILYGAGASVYFAPSWVISPFFSLGGGGLSIVPNADTFVLKKQSMYVARAGGGLVMALRSRVLIRLEAQNLTLFTPDSVHNALIIEGGIGAYF